MCGIILARSPDTNEGLDVLLLGLKYLERRGPEGKGATFINPMTKNIISTWAISDNEKEEFVRTAKRFARANRATMFMGQTRYITDDRPDDKQLMYANTQPMHLWFDGLHGLLQEGVGVHNGQIQKKKDLEKIVLASAPSIADVDTRYLIELCMQRLRLKADPWEAMEMVMQDVLEIDGAASVGYTDGNKIMAWRDPQGYRPLVVGKVNDTQVIISESGFFNEAAAEFSNVTIERIIEPGEMVVIDNDGKLESRILVSAVHKPCDFEDKYIKDELSLDNAGNHSARYWRRKIGSDVAKMYKEVLAKADLIIPAPNSGIDYALGASHQIGIPYEGDIRKPMRKKDARFFLYIKSGKMHSFVTDGDSLKNKRVAVFEDSIMRGDTAAKLYAALKDADVNEVDLYSGWPPTLFDCYYGVDVKSEELVAYKLKEAGIIRLTENGVEYDIHEVNKGVTNLIREKVMEMYGEKYGDVSDLNIYYATIPIIEKNQATKTACKRCIDGR